MTLQHMFRKPFQRFTGGILACCGHGSMFPMLKHGAIPNIIIGLAPRFTCPAFRWETGLDRA